MPTDWFPLWLSLKVAALATALALLPGLWAGWRLAHRGARGQAMRDAVVGFPLALPPTVLFYYLLVLFGRDSPLGRFCEGITGSPPVFSWQAAVVAAMFQSVPLLAIWGRAALESVKGSYQRAARSLGASEWRVFWRISLPLAWRSILAATALAFARSLGDFGITIMIAGYVPGRTETLAGAIYQAAHGGHGGLARALVVAISVAAITLLFLFNRRGSGRVTG